MTRPIAADRTEATLGRFPTRSTMVPAGGPPARARQRREPGGLHEAGAAPGPAGIATADAFRHPRTVGPVAGAVDVLTPLVAARTEVGRMLSHPRQGADSLDTRLERMPLPKLNAPEVAPQAGYVITVIDDRGRVADRSPLRALGWGPGLRLSLRLFRGVLVVAAHSDGTDALTRQGHLRISADLRHAWHLSPGDHLLIAAHLPERVLMAYTMPALDAMVATYHAKLANEASA